MVAFWWLVFCRIRWKYNRLCTFLSNLIFTSSSRQSFPCRGDKNLGPCLYTYRLGTMSLIGCSDTMINRVLRVMTIHSQWHQCLELTSVHNGGPDKTCQTSDCGCLPNPLNKVQGGLCLRQCQHFKRFRRLVWVSRDKFAEYCPVQAWVE